MSEHPILNMQPQRISVLLDITIADALKLQTAVRCHDELVEACTTMKALCRLKYGNLDKDVYAKIQEAEAAIAKATT